MKPCLHKFVYGGVRYKDSEYPMAGTGAHERSYFEWFYCEKCLKKIFNKLDFTGNTYEKHLFDSILMAQE